MTDSDQNPPAVLAQARLGPLKEMLSTLQGAGIAAEIVRPPDSDANG